MAHLWLADGAAAAIEPVSTELEPVFTLAAELDVRPAADDSSSNSGSTEGSDAAGTGSDPVDVAQPSNNQCPPTERECSTESDLVAPSRRGHVVDRSPAVQQRAAAGLAACGTAADAAMGTPPSVSPEKTSSAGRGLAAPQPAKRCLLPHLHDTTPAALPCSRAAPKCRNCSTESGENWDT